MKNHNNKTLNQKLSQWFFPENLEYVETLFNKYREDHNSVDSHWQKIFSSIDSPNELKATIVDGKQSSIVSDATTTRGISTINNVQYTISELMCANYRLWGHYAANIDPLQLQVIERKPELELAYYGISKEQSSLKVEDKYSAIEWFQRLNKIYCQDIGVEFEHINSQLEKDWLYAKFENIQLNHSPTKEQQISLLRTLCAAENLEKHLASRYPGTKRFGLEGAESLIPLLEQSIKQAGLLGAQEIVMGMPHRGRLNVLVNIMGKSARELFDEFEGKQTFGTTGDVKYHQGFSTNVQTPGGEVHLALNFNPSHLEIVSPVVIGSVKARQDRRRDSNHEKVVPIVLHGDAAFSGQGVVMETFQMSLTRAHKVGGTIHIIINNQVGFTTHRQDDARSTKYCTEVAKIIKAPIFHINADNPEKVLEIAKMAMEYRYKYKKDVVIDLVCYRRRGHNETDEPSSTQPIMYKTIKSLPTTYNLYMQRLVTEKIVIEHDFLNYQRHYRTLLDKDQFQVPMLIKEPNTTMFVDWLPYLNHNWDTPADTSFNFNRLQQLANKISEIPAAIKAQAQVQKIYQNRQQMAAGKMPINWGMAELLAYATLADENYSIRLSGQDSQRGTFSHRHSTVFDQNTAEEWRPLTKINPDVKVEVFDTLLSEEAVLGFEYGYASTKPDTLTIWEAQFGDFGNGAQVVIDQFIASAEHKWSRLSGLTLLLPHGYEGQGPEHSSARLERFLQLCAEQNMQICIPTTPSQIFHLLRLQLIRPMRRPLVILTPKMLLRHSAATSTLEELATTSFMPVIVPSNVNYQQITKVLLCSGKIYYHLQEALDKAEISNICIIRIEQLYPFPDVILQRQIMHFKKLKAVVWVQEEPLNQGAWYTSQHNMKAAVSNCFTDIELKVIAREASSAPACGYVNIHQQEQQQLINEALKKI